jgi:hypothetical protein
MDEGVTRMSYVSVKRKVSTRKKVRKSQGIVYVLEVSIDGVARYKVGITARGGRALESRVMEISSSYYSVYGYFPQIVPLRYAKTKWYYEVEAEIHSKLGSRLECKKFDGSTEMFGCNREEVLRWYDVIMSNPLEYVTPTECGLAKQAAMAEFNSETSMNDLEPVVIDI